MKLRDSLEFEKSRYDWIGAVPKSWSIYPLKALCNEFDSVFIDGDWIESEDIEEDGIIRYLTSGNVGVGVYKDQGSSFITEKKFQDLNCTEVLPGDILVSRLNLPIARACIVPEFDSRLVTCVDNVIVRPNSNISRRFLVYLLSSEHHFANTKNLGRGTTMQRISGKMLGKIRFAIPSHDEQELIANFLDRETAKIDELIQRQERLIDLYGERINALVLDGMANPGTKYVRLLHVSDVISRPVSQEDDGSYRPLGLYNKGRGIFIKEERESDDMGDSDFFWIKPGDLIFSGQFAWEGAVAIAQLEHDGCVVSHRYPVIKGKENIALTEYLLALFQTSHGDFLLNENSRGAAGRNRPLNISLLLKEKIPIIDMQSQLKIKRLIESKEQFLKKSAQEILLLKEHRASLISAAVTGKIDVGNFV